MSAQRLPAATIGALIGGVTLMLAFDLTVTRILGVALILAFIVLGTFTIATPEYLGEDGDDD